MTELQEQDIKFLESLKQEYAFLFEQLINDKGKSNEEALEILKAVAVERDVYLRKTESITVPIRFELSFLQKNTGWDKMNYKERDKLLNGLGMDTRANKYENGRFLVGRNTGGGYVIERVEMIYGQERLDDKWVNMKVPVNNGTNYTYYASEEARTYNWFRRHGKGAMYG